MKRLICWMSIPLLFYACSADKQGAQIFDEDGIEIVINPLDPCPEKGEPGTFETEELFAIDTEDENTAELGLTDFGSYAGSYFDVNSQGDIFLYNPENENPIFFCFDAEGRFQDSFSHRGQGPGELQRSLNFAIFREGEGMDRLAVTDTQNNKLVTLDSHGELIREIRLDSDVQMVFPLPPGNFLVNRRRSDPSGKYLVTYRLKMAGPDLVDLKELDRQWIPNPLTGEMLKGMYYILSWAVSEDLIFTGFQERDYDIWVFDFSGNPVRKIRKKFRPVPVPAEHKHNFLKQFEAPQFAEILKKIYFPGGMPAFHSLFCDEEGHLFVRTYEPGNSPGENMVDIFNRKGIFIGRVSLGGFRDEFGSQVRVRAGRLYQVEEKDSGYKRLVVYRMRWH